MPQAGRNPLSPSWAQGAAGAPTPPQARKEPGDGQCPCRGEAGAGPAGGCGWGGEFGGWRDEGPPEPGRLVLASPIPSAACSGLTPPSSPGPTRICLCLSRPVSLCLPPLLRPELGLCLTLPYSLALHLSFSSSSFSSSLPTPHILTLSPFLCFSKGEEGRVDGRSAHDQELPGRSPR